MGFLKGDTSSWTENCYTGGTVENKKIETYLGMIQYTRTDIDVDVKTKISDIFNSLVNNAKEDGADAVINVKMTTGTYQVGTSKTTTYITVFGEGVVFEKNEI